VRWADVNTYASPIEHRADPGNKHGGNTISRGTGRRRRPTGEAQAPQQRGGTAASAQRACALRRTMVKEERRRTNDGHECTRKGKQPARPSREGLAEKTSQSRSQLRNPTPTPHNSERKDEQQQTGIASTKLVVIYPHA
jgi:hypothetical protein